MKKILLNACSKTGGYSFRDGTYLRKEGVPVPPPADLLSGGTVLKNSRSVVSGLDAKKEFFVKHYRKNGLWRTLKRLLQFPRAWRCLGAALLLEETGLKTPRVLLASRFYLVTEVLPPKAVFLTEQPEAMFDFIPSLARIHEAGLSHGDLNLRNLYKQDGDFGLIDLDSARCFEGGVPPRERIRELARLVSSYLKQTGLAPEKAQAVIEKAAERYRQETGFQPYGKSLIERVKYLTERRKH